jgi:hypothetical protein
MRYTFPSCAQVCDCKFAVSAYCIIKYSICSHIRKKNKMSTHTTSCYQALRRAPCSWKTSFCFLMHPAPRLIGYAILVCTARINLKPVLACQRSSITYITQMSMLVPNLNMICPHEMLHIKSAGNNEASRRPEPDLSPHSETTLDTPILGSFRK